MQVKYITIAGRFVKGVPLNGQGSLLAKFAGAGYAQVCGQADVDGDFIVPLPSAHLDGAVNVNLDGVFHSPLGTKLPFFGPWCARLAADDACMQPSGACVRSLRNERAVLPPRRTKTSMRCRVQRDTTPPALPQVWQRRGGRHLDALGD